MIQQLSELPAPWQRPRLDEPVVLCASDDFYIRPLAVTLLSAVSNLKRGRHLQVLLMDGGIRAESWQGLKETLAGLPISIHILKPDPNEIADLGISHHITHTAYFRLLAGRLLPDSIERVIYLDSDTLLLDDITELWQAELGNHYCLAAVDVACPFMDARQAPVEYRRAMPYLATISPVRNYRELGIEGSAPYFNSGVMVLNLQRWRQEKIEQRLLSVLREHRKFVWCWDQYALNVVFAGQWGKIPARWNQGSHLYEYPDENTIPIRRSEYREMRERPSLIHYTTEFKPWKYDPYRKYHFSHPLHDLWYQWLDRTAWAGWRPTPQPSTWHQWWTAQAVYWSKRSGILYRKSLQKLSGPALIQS